MINDNTVRFTQTLTKLQSEHAMFKNLFAQSNAVHNTKTAIIMHAMIKMSAHSLTMYHTSSEKFQ